MDLASYNSVFLSTFGVEVTFTPAGGAAETVTVVVSDSQSLGEAAPGVQMLVSGSVEASGFSQAPAKGDTFTISGSSYRVFSARVDQHGWFTVALTQ